MAEQPSRKQQNQAFLQELEKQRLNKPCLRIIDLRGKVAGECQAYEFGDRVHYLDDRAYLLVKQLMARFDGRYTNGVYEALFKALKQLNESPTPTASSEEPRFLSLAQTVQRSHSRTALSTPVKLRLNDMLYHGHTVDLSATAIRVACKRTFSLEPGDRLKVEFTELPQQPEHEGLQAIPYRIIKLDHDASHTQLVLQQDTEHNDLTAVLAQWLEQQAAPRQQNVDNELLNLQNAFYQRLWLSHLRSPLLWLSSESKSSPLLRLHLAPAAEALLAASGLDETDWLAKLPLQQLLKQGGSMVCALNQHHSFSVSIDQTSAVQALINWHLAATGSQLLLLQTASVRLSPEQLNDCLDKLKTVELEPDATAELKNLTCLLTVCELSPSFSHVVASTDTAPEQLNAWQTQTGTLRQIPEPTPLRPCIQRHDKRFYIHTPVTVHTRDSEWQVDTIDVSAGGLAISAPDTVPVSVNQRLQVSFSRWQTLTNKVKLDAIPYQIKNIRHWQGQQRLGLERIKINCPESLNRFFDEVIEQNQQSLHRNQQDVLTAAESQLFSEIAVAAMNSVPVFLGLNHDTQQRTVSIGQTQANQAGKDRDYWLSMEALSWRWHGLLKQSSSQSHDNMTTTAYSYKSGQKWTHALEQDFNQPREKTVFIQRALAADAFKVMQTTVTVLKGQEAALEHDLMARLQQWRSQHPHRTHELRLQLGQLVGLLEMTDISLIMQLHYMRQHAF